MLAAKMCGKLEAHFDAPGRRFGSNLASLSGRGDLGSGVNEKTMMAGDVPIKKGALSVRT